MRAALMSRQMTQGEAQMEETLKSRPMRGWRAQTSPALLALAALPIGVIRLFVAVMIWVSFQRGLLGASAAAYTLENYRAVFTDPFLYRVLWNTVVFTLSTTVVALAIGLPIAWLAERTTIPGKTLIYAIMTLGLLIPGIYTAMGWTFIAHPRIGILNRWLMDLFGLDNAPLNIATPIGMGFVQGLSLAAVVFILTAQMFRAMNPSLEEDAKVHVLTFFGSIQHVTRVTALPAI